MRVWNNRVNIRSDRGTRLPFHHARGNQRWTEQLVFMWPALSPINAMVVFEGVAIVCGCMNDHTLTSGLRWTIMEIRASDEHHNLY